MKKLVWTLGLLGWLGLHSGCGEPTKQPIAKGPAPKIGETGTSQPTVTMIAGPTAEKNPPIEASKLEIGQVAPEIIGPDFDGVEFKLSDYRGKVVVLDFWGDW